MPFSLYDSGEGRSAKPKGTTSLAPGIVMNNCDLIMQGKIQVRIPSMGVDVWARVVGAGAGNGRGLMFVPQIRDEVLVAFNMEDPRDAFILGGLWSNLTRLPALAPTDPLSKRTLRSGFAPGVGHVVELDDALQMITIRATTGQTIMLSPAGIQILATLTALINVTPGGLQIMLGDNIINLTPDGITLASPKAINIASTGAVNITGASVNITGANVKIN